MKFRRKPVVVEAVQWFRDGDHPAVVPLVVQRYDEGGRMVLTRGANIYPNDQEYMPGMEKTHGYIRTLAEGHIVSPGDWIITDAAGEHYPCKPDIFKATYEPVAEEVPDDGAPCEVCGARSGVRYSNAEGREVCHACYEHERELRQ